MVIGFFSLAKEENRGAGQRDVMAMLSHGSATDVARVFRKDVHLIFAKMEADGLKVTSGDETLDALATESQKKPEKILAYFLK